ncbi:MAG: DUF5522 domain-containing protein [Candidatus Nanopelagicales bacterium]
MNGPARQGLAAGPRRPEGAPSQLADRPLETPHPARLPASHPTYDEILVRHAEAMRIGQAGYPDPVTGLFVMTAETHATRGWCCQRGCRHCPYLD